MSARFDNERLTIDACLTCVAESYNALTDAWRPECQHWLEQRCPVRVSPESQDSHIGELACCHSVDKEVPDLYVAAELKCVKRPFAVWRSTISILETMRSFARVHDVSGSGGDPGRDQDSRTHRVAHLSRMADKLQGNTSDRLGKIGRRVCRLLGVFRHH
jgi:hypothetical protein